MDSWPKPQWDHNIIDLHWKVNNKFAITKTWEEIPTKVKTRSYHKFKKEYKQILVNSQR